MIEVAFHAISFLKNAAVNLFPIESESLILEYKYVTAFMGHDVYCIENCVDCDFHQTILDVYQH